MKLNKPLLKRSFKEYGRDIAKFGILQLFMIILFTLSAGYIVGTSSVDNKYNGVVTSETMEDGNFVTFFPITNESFKRIENECDVNLEAQFYQDFILNDQGHGIRTYTNREKIDKVTIKSGRLPENSGEIAIIDLYSNENNIGINSKLKFGLLEDIINNRPALIKEFTIVGIVNFPDYICVYQSRTDASYKQRTFATSIITEEDFQAFAAISENVTHVYGYRFNTRPSAGSEAVINLELQNKINDILYEDQSSINFMTQFVPVAQNRCISTGQGFAKQYDSFIMIFIYIIIIIIAFAFGISTVARVNEESKTIGTLRASGYTRGSLVSLYTILPLFIVITSAIIGDLLGFFVFAPFFANIFLGILSLPTVTFTFTGLNIFTTTIIPSILMILINVIILIVAFKTPVRKLLTGEVSKNSKKKAVELNEKSKFTSRFKKRILLQNIPNFIILSIGICLGSILFTFGISYKVSTNAQLDLTYSQAICDYQYMLRIPQNTTVSGAEEMLAYSMGYQKNQNYKKANISVFGVIDNSDYVKIDFPKDEDDEYKEGVFISSAFAAKYNVKIGEIITLSDPNNLKNIDLNILGIYKYDVTPCIFAPISKVETYYLDLLDITDKTKLVNALSALGIILPHGCLFNGYYTNEIIDDIDVNMITSIIDKETLYNDIQQLNKNANPISILVIVIGVAFNVLLMYLLIKQIIDKNRNNIAMCKILGFSNVEVTKLYIQTTSIVAGIALLISLPLSYIFSKLIYVGLIYPSMISFMVTSFPWWIFVVCFGCGALTYVISTLLEYGHIKKISMVDILKS